MKKKIVVSIISFGFFLLCYIFLPKTFAKTGSYCVQVPVLYYHHVKPTVEARRDGQTGLYVDTGIFQQQMQYLVSHGYTTITAKQLFDSLVTHSPLPAKSVVLTFDDGYSDIYTNALPIFKNLHITTNLLIPSGLINNPGYMSWGQVKEMKDSGSYLIDHTFSHKALSSILPKVQMQFEIMTSKTQIEQNTGQTVSIFGYPYGTTSGLAVSLLQQDGFQGGFTTNPGTYECSSNLLTEPRKRIGNASLSYYGL